MTHDNPGPAATQIVSSILRVMEEDASPSDAVIHEDQAFSLSTEFELVGSAPPSGSFTINYYFESIGAGPEGTLASVTSQLDPSTRRYGHPDTTARVEAGTLFQGVYRLASVVTISGTQISGFVEGPVIQVV
jgi:hypothetical protein